MNNSENHIVEPSAALNPDLISEFRKTFASDHAAPLMQNALAQTPIDKVALNRDIVQGIHHSFSHQLDDWKVTNQEKSGRCWLFAGLNLLRPQAMKLMNLEQFEFSQSFVFFWDKLERANYFLETVIKKRHDPIDDRDLAYHLENPLDDGGQWNMFVNIIDKHGLVPKNVMPESESSRETMKMNYILKAYLRQGACQLRMQGDSNEADIRETKQTLMSGIFRILAQHLGTPPVQFNWQWRDKAKAFHNEGTLTPLEFRNKFVTENLNDYACLVHDPRPQNEFGKTYTLRHFNNVACGRGVKYLNVDMQSMKDIAKKMILDGSPVWMGCDVAKMMERTLGIWDAKTFDLDKVYGTPLNLTKADRLTYHETKMTHAMLFTGVDIDNRGQPIKWRVENSWGDEGGDSGFFLMNDNWFDEYVFEIATPGKYLSAALQKALSQDPIELAPWDPMGALA